MCRFIVSSRLLLCHSCKGRDTVITQYQRWVVIILLCCMSPLGLANQPLKLSADNRIEVVAYSPYSVVPVHGTTYTTTQITFGKEESILNVQNGDLGAWVASINPKMANMIFLKPVVYGSNTNMTIVTNRHTYYFHLISNTKGNLSQKQATYAIHFVYR